MSARKVKKRATTPFERICRSFGLDPKVVSKAWSEQRKAMFKDYFRRLYDEVKLP